MKLLVLCVSVAAFSGTAALAQSVISARSGLIHYVEGRVVLGGQPVESKFGSFPEVKENTILSTESGRTEILLTPGVFLRIGENSSFRMITNRLVDTRVEFLSGSAVIEADDLMKDNAVTVVYKDATVRLLKNGLYRFNSNPPALRVFNGDAEVESAGNKLEVKEGKMLAFNGEFAAVKFDKEDTDSLDRWSRRRGEYISMANVSAANSIRQSGSSWNSSGWAWNPYFGMFTFIPGSGAWSSPYGYRFWSPYSVYQVYQPRVWAPSNSAWVGGGSGSYGAMGRTPSGYSGTMAGAASIGSVAPSHAPSTSAGSAPSAPVSHGSGGAGGSRR